jgi:hypothetical protein
MSHYDKNALTRSQVIRKDHKYVWKDRDGTVRDMTHEERSIWNDGIGFGLGLGVLIMAFAIMLIAVL